MNDYVETMVIEGPLKELRLQDEEQRLAESRTGETIRVETLPTAEALEDTAAMRSWLT